MSGDRVPAGFSEHMLDLDEDEDLEVFSKNTSLGDGSSMPHSPSSLVNQYRLDDEEEELQVMNSKDIFISVSNPESHVTAVETFIMYKVVTRTTRSTFDSSEYEVSRRYQDFLWLRSKLEDNHPTLIVHPLPEKFVMKGMVERFNETFIETRRRALNRFLNKISEHPILSYSEHFHVFLTAQELAPHKKQGPGFLSRMGETMRAVANSVRGLRTRPEEFTVMQEYVEDFSSKVISVDKVTQRIIKEKREHLDELKQYGPTYSQWAESEDGLADSLRGVASCVEQCNQETEAQISHLSDILLPALHEYVLCAETLKTVLKRRDKIQADFDTKNEALLSRKDDQDALQEEVNTLADRIDLANKALRGDWSRWHSGMRSDLKSAFLSTAEKNMQYYEKCLTVWESFLLSQRTEAWQQKDSGDVS